jgi:hypothetical protein
MERTTTTATDITGDCEHNVLARQMIGQRFVFRTSVVGLGDDYRTALPDAGNVAVEVFKRERQLIGIGAFGAPPELRPLQLLDDGLESRSGSRRQQPSRAPDGATAPYRTADFQDRTACAILREYADSKKQVRYILCGFLRCFNPQLRASRCAPVSASRCLQSTLRAARETR